MPSPLHRTSSPVSILSHRTPIPIPSPLPSPLHSIPTPASSPLQNTPGHLVIEPKLEPNQDEIEDNLSGGLGAPVLKSTNEKESMEFEDNSVPCAKNTKEEATQQESTGLYLPVDKFVFFFFYSKKVSSKSHSSLVFFNSELNCHISH